MDTVLVSLIVGEFLDVLSVVGGSLIVGGFFGVLAALGAGEELGWSRTKVLLLAGAMPFALWLIAVLFGGSPSYEDMLAAEVSPQADEGMPFELFFTIAAVSVAVAAVLVPKIEKPD